MGFMIFLTATLFIAASAVGCFPDKQKTAIRLSAAACVMMAVTAAASVLIKDGMFADLAALPQGLLAQAALSVLMTVAAGVIIVFIIERHQKRKKQKSGTE